MASDFRLDPRFVKALYRSENVRRILHDKAEQVADAARSSAPVESGAYRDSITADAGPMPTPNGVFMVGRVSASDFKAVWVEFGTSDTPKHATLRKALDSL